MYIDPEFDKLINLKSQSVTTVFDDLWNRDDPWFEEINIGRRLSKNCWSGVTRIEYNEQAFFLKKQENYFSYTIKPPFRSLFVQKEFTNIATFTASKIPTLEVVFFGVRKKSGKTQGILITKALDNYTSLDFNDSEQSKIKKNIITNIAVLVKKLHVSGLMHNCLYPKHIYIEKGSLDPVCRFIDLEGAKKASYMSKKQLRDLETLDRRLPFLDPKDKLYFLLQYLGKKKLDKETKKLIDRVKKISRK